MATLCGHAVDQLEPAHAIGVERRDYPGQLRLDDLAEVGRK
jgi:hypothetical protein